MHQIIIFLQLVINIHKVHILVFFQQIIQFCLGLNISLCIACTSKIAFSFFSSHPPSMKFFYHSHRFHVQILYRHFSIAFFLVFCSYSQNPFSLFKPPFLCLYFTIIFWYKYFVSYQPSFFFQFLAFLL